MSWGNRAGKKTGTVWEAGGCQDSERLGRAGQRPHRAVGVRGPAPRLVAGGPSDSRQGRATAGKPLRLEAEALRASVRKKHLETAWRFWFPPVGCQSNTDHSERAAGASPQLPGRRAHRLLEPPASLPCCPFRDGEIRLQNQERPAFPAR